MLRFAQSPTGDMHIDNLRIAILNYLVAQQRKEPFIIRIDDGDKESNIEGKDTEIMQILEKFALIHESVFHQSEHLHMHQTLAIKLLEEKKAFVCLCTPEEIESDKEKSKSWGLNYTYHGRCIDAPYDVKTLKEEKTPFVIRMNQPDTSIYNNDLIQGDICTAPNDVGSFIILNIDGTPSHDFACACDDMLSGISIIIREEIHLDSTPKQEYIKTQLGYTEKTSYAHLPMSTDTEGENSVQWLFEQGFIPDAIINYLLLLGNTHAPKEIFTLPEAIEWFKLEDISSLLVKFNIDTLKYINRGHLRMMDDKQLSSLFGFADADVGKLVKLYLEEASTINELASKIRPIFAPKVFEGKWSEEMVVLQHIIEDAPMIHTFDAFKTYVMDKSKLKDENFFTPLRLLLTGAEHGPELSDIYPLIKAYLLEVAS
jgi:glutamyl-tRNA synthetase